MRRLLGILLSLVIVSVASAEEHGRGALTVEGGTRVGLGRSGLSPAQSNGFALGGTWGTKVSVGWVSADWDVGDASGSESLFAPQASVFYKTTDSLDVNFSALFFSADDADDDLGANSAEMTRLAIGVRYWMNMRGRVTPYLGGGLGYYLLDGQTARTYENSANMSNPVNVASISTKDAPGAFVEAGVAFQISDSLFINADLTHDFLLGGADATINGVNEDFDVKALSLNLGVTFML